MVITPIQRIKALLKFGEDAFTKFSYLFSEPFSQVYASEAIQWHDLIIQIKFMLIRFSSEGVVMDDSLALALKAFLQRCNRMEKLRLFDAEIVYKNAHSGQRMLI